VYGSSEAAILGRRRILKNPMCAKSCLSKVCVLANFQSLGQICNWIKSVISRPCSYFSVTISHGEMSCSTAFSLCHSQATCVDTNQKFCCICRKGFYGNGLNCLKEGMWLRVCSIRRECAFCNRIMNIVRRCSSKSEWKSEFECKWCSLDRPRLTSVHRSKWRESIRRHFEDSSIDRGFVTNHLPSNGYAELVVRHSNE